MQSVMEANKRSGQIVQSYQSVWMAHWTRTSSNSEADTRSEKDNITSGLLVPRPVKVLGAKTSDIVNESLTMSPNSLGNYGTAHSLIRHGEQTDEIQALRPMFGQGLEHSKSNFGFVKGKAAIFSNHQLPNASMRILDQEGCQLADTSMNACFREGNTALLLDVPSTSQHQLQNLGQEWFQKIQKCSKKSSYGFYSPQKLPNCVQNLDMTRVCTTVEETAVNCPSFSSQTTHSLLITKQTKMNTPKEDNLFRSRRVLTNNNRDLHGILPLHDQGKGGVRLQSLSSRSDSGGKRNIGHEASADTDTMDMNTFKEKRPNSGVSPFCAGRANSTPSIKAVNVGSNLSPGTGLHDINLKTPLPAVASSLDHICPSSSRTQSLEMDMLLAHAEKPKRKSSFDLNDCPNADPSERWLKRLKPSSDLSGKPSHEKISKYFTEPTLSKHVGKEQMLLSKSLDEDLKVDALKKDKDLLLSHAWIQRFLSKGSRFTEKKADTKGSRFTEKKADTVVICEPQSSKLALEDLQKKQFPSIAAMAMMGKTMNGFRSCEIQKKGSFTVWNTKSF